MDLPMTDAEILEAAARIKRRQKNEARLASLNDAKGVAIRWDVPGAPFGESYVSVPVAVGDVRELVTSVLKPQILADATNFAK